MVAAEPETIATKVMMAPTDKVEKPVMPWPTVQPIAVTPPKPISTPPMMWRNMSCAETKCSQRNALVAIA
jgi:hypothetical protein